MYVTLRDPSEPTCPGTTRGGNCRERKSPRQSVSELKIHEIACESERHFYLTMDSMRHDLRDALDEAEPDTTTQASAATDHSSHQGKSKCWKCGSFPASGSKQRYCGRCESTPYCCKACARADWAEHKLACDSLRRAHTGGVAAYEVRGGLKKNFRKNSRDVQGWFQGVPGLFNEIELLAWKHRGDAPFVYVTSPQSDGDGSGIRIRMIPRRIWQDDPRFLDTFGDTSRELLRLRFDASSLSPNEIFVCMLAVHPQGQPAKVILAAYLFGNTLISGTAIVDALTAATRADDLADAFAWVAESCPSDSVHSCILENMRNRAWQHHAARVRARAYSGHQQRGRNVYNAHPVS